MKFDELEKLMYLSGANSLAEIARILGTTPQAVSNWKARDQIPHRIIIKVNSLAKNGDQLKTSSEVQNLKIDIDKENNITIPDILLTIAEQLKLIVIVFFISVFLTFSYVQFIKVPQYVSWATILLPPSISGGNNLGGLAGLASQFGVNIPTDAQADLSSPSLLPEILNSRSFAEKILIKKFHTKEFGKELSLLAILTHGDKPAGLGRDTLITMALLPLRKMIKFDQDPTASISVIKTTAKEPIFAKELAEATLSELEKLNRFYKNQTVNQTIGFIANRISSVENDLESLERKLKDFNEKNRQISSPALQLEQDRLIRDLDIQKGIYLTLKQQLELSKIEEIQERSIVQILDKPQAPFEPSNKNLKLSILMSGVLGLGLGIILGFLRSYLNRNNSDERKKLRRIKYLLKKKSIDLFNDHRVSGIISSFLLLGLPLFLGYKSANPVFFGLYSAKLMIINIIYILALTFTFILFIYSVKKNK